MAISLIGELDFNTGAFNAAGQASISLSGLTLAQNDVLVIILNHNHTGIVDVDASGNVSGTISNNPVANSRANGTYDTNLSVFVAKMGATPDSSVQFTAAGTGTSTYYVAKVQQWRDVDGTTQLDVATPTPATGTNGSLANPPSITPATAGARIIGIYAAAKSSAAAWTAPSNSSNWTEITNTTPAAGLPRLGVSHHEWTSGAFDPDAVTGGSSSTSDSWVGATIALRPGAAVQNLDPPLLTNSQTFHAPTVSASYTLSPSLLTNGQTFHAPTVTSAVTLSPPLVTNAQTFYSPSISQTTTLAPPLLDSSASVFAPTVAPGAVTLSPSLLTSAASIFAPTVTSSLTLFPPVLDTSATIHVPTVTSSYALTAPLLTNSQTFYAPTVAYAATTLYPPLLYSSGGGGGGGAIVTVTQF